MVVVLTVEHAPLPNSQRFVVNVCIVLHGNVYISIIITDCVYSNKNHMCSVVVSQFAIKE